MNASLLHEKRVLLQHLLAQVAGSLHGAIDFWTVVCLGRIPPDARAFIRREMEILRSHVVVAQSVLASARDAYPEPCRQLRNMYLACQKLEDTFLVLADHRHVSLDEVRSATEALAEAYTELSGSVVQLIQSLDLCLPRGQDFTPDGEEYYRQILNGLFDQFRRERESDLSPSSAAPDPRTSS